VCESLVMDLSMEQRLAIKFCFKAGKGGTETLHMVNGAHGDQALSSSNVFRWYERFRDGQEDSEEDLRSGLRSVAMTTMSRRFLSCCFKPSPFAKNASRRGEHWQGHTEKGCI
jgi:hypothetical protein